jgi:RecJ-like exonuclease
LSKVTTESDNPFICEAESGEVNTGFVVVNVWNRESDEQFELSEFIDVYVIPHMRRNTKQMAEGSFSVPIKRVHNRDMLDDCIAVHKTAA